MKDAEPFLESAGETAEYIRQYVQLQADYLRLEVAEKMAKTASSLIATLVVAMLGGMVLLMLTLAAGFYLGDRWHSNALAFLCVAGFYAVLALLVWAFKTRWLTNPMLSSIIRSFFD